MSVCICFIVREREKMSVLWPTAGKCSCSYSQKYSTTHNTTAQGCICEKGPIAESLCIVGCGPVVSHFISPGWKKNGTRVETELGQMEKAPHFHICWSPNG